MLNSCISEEAPGGTIKPVMSTASKQSRNSNLDSELVMQADDLIKSDSDIINQTSLTQTSSDSSFTSHEEFDDDCCSTSSDESDISLCRTRKFGQAVDLNRQAKRIGYSSGTYAAGSELTADSSECVTTSIADFFFGSEGPCTHIAENEQENEAINNKPPDLRRSALRPAPVQKKSSLKQVATILDKSSLNRRNRNVSFHMVDVREYKISISLNPSCSEGPPIELGWEFHSLPSVSVDRFEQCRGPKRRLPEFVLSETSRRRMLLERGGYSRQELKEAVREVEHHKRQRILTYMMLPARALDEAAEEMFEALTSAFK